MCPTVSEQQENILAADSPFRFACHDDLPCFTQCCRDVNIYLTPYDVLRLRRALNIPSGEVLSKYTRHFLAGSAKIPMVQLLMDPDTLYCKLVTERGCTVYENRPWSCRMYPLDQTEKRGEYRTIVGKDRCMGLTEPSKYTVQEWLQGQGTEPYPEMDSAFQSIMPEEFELGLPTSAEIGKLHFFAYDVDRFAEFLHDPSFCDSFDVDKELLKMVREDDEELLRLAFRYIRSQMDALYDMV